MAHISSRLVSALAVAALGSTTALVTAPPAEAAVRTSAPVVSRADVDGDGRADVTTLTSSRKGTVHTLRTVTATGRAASVRIATPWLGGGDVFRGAAALDGAKGAELVVNTSNGAHTQFFSVYSWRGGRLVAQKDPATGSTEWITDGALSSSMGYTVRTVKGVRQLTSLAVARDSWGENATFSGRRVVSQWKAGRWVAVSDRAVVLPDTDAVWTGAGWNVSGLPRW